MEDLRRDAPVCPPHHWIIFDEVSGLMPRRLSRCARCQEEREDALSRVTVPNRKYRSMSTWSREECILAGIDADG